MLKRNKRLIWFNAIIGVIGVFVCAISTFAWFQIDSQAPTTTIKTKDPNLTIDNENVTGYKVSPTIGTDGFIDKTSSTVTAKKGSFIDTTNNNQAIADTNFDVPSQGLGYYLVKKNPGGSYKYKYNSTAYSWKFKELTTAGANYLKIDAATLGAVASTDSFIIRE